MSDFLYWGKINRMSFFIKTIAFLFLFGAASSDYINAQSTLIGVKGGLNIPNLSDNTDNIYSSNFSSISTLGIGFFLDFPVSGVLSIQTELMFAGRGGSRSGIQPLPPSRVPALLKSFLPAGAVPYAEFENKSILNYLEIPVLGKLNFGKEVQFSVYGGPYLGLLLNAKQTISGSSSLFLDPSKKQALSLPPNNAPLVLSLEADVNTEDELKSLNFGVHGGLILSKEIGTSQRMFLDTRVTYGLVPVQENKTFGESKVGSVSFSLGFAQLL